MPKFNGTLCFDITIKEQTSQEAVNALAETIFKAIDKITGVDSCDEVDRDIDEEDDEE